MIELHHGLMGTSSLHLFIVTQHIILVAWVKFGQSTLWDGIVAGKFKLSGADNPGIVHKLTSVLARNSLTIGSMKTSNEEAPFGGTELFTSKYLTAAVIL